MADLEIQDRFPSQNTYCNVSFDFGNDTDVHFYVQSDMDLQTASHAFNLVSANLGGVKGTQSPSHGWGPGWGRGAS
jgi:hypothetical protein